VSEDYLYDVVVIGAGISGLSAALYLSRLGLKTVVVSVDVGGQLAYAPVIENYPGLEPLPGIELVYKVRDQVKSYGVNIIVDEVVSIEKVGDVFVVKTRRGFTYKSLAVIAACGKAPKKLGVEGEEGFIGKGLSYCVVCDGPLFKGRKVLLVSFGVKGVEGLELLAPIALEVHYVVPNVNDVSVEVAKKFSNVRIYPGYKVIKLLGEGKVSKAVIQSGNDVKELEVDGVFVELGFETRIDFLKQYVDINENGEVVVDNLGRTKLEGLFAAGDLVNIPYKQAVIAAASGVIAALSAINYVNKVKGVERRVRADWEKKVGVSKKKPFRL
jgi:thioredoxin reductase (NADPH)